MKRLLSFIFVFCLLFSFIAGYERSAFAQDAKEEIRYSKDGSRFVFVTEEPGKFYVKNVPADEFVEIMDSSEDWEPILLRTLEPQEATESLGPDLRYAQELFEEFNSVAATQTNTFERTYTARTSIKGVTGETLYINYLVVMNVTSMTYNGTTYDLFVSICSPESENISASLGSSLYTPAAGWRNPVGTVTDSGARLKISQIIQVERQVSYSISLASDSSWYEVSAGVVYTYRTELIRKTTYIKLPIYNVLY